MSIKGELENIKTHLRSARMAIIGRGGEISPTAGLKDLASAIYNIPADSATAQVVDDTSALTKFVPQNSINHCYLNKLGGMSYKSKNLFSEGTVEVNATSYHAFSLEAGKTYYFSAYVTSTDTDDPTQCVINLQYEDGSQAYIYVPRNQRFKKVFTPPQYVTIMRLFSGQNFPTSAGDTSTWKDIMITTEDTDVYEPYFEGLRDTKVTEIQSAGSSGVISTTTVPEAIQNLEGYGAGVNAENHNYIDFERKVFVQNTNRKVFDGTENFHFNVYLQSAYGRNAYQVAVSGLKGDKAPLCNLFECLKWSVNAGVAVNSVWYLDNALIFITDGQQTVEEFKAYVKEQYDRGNPIIVEYALEAPVETQIDVPDPLIEVEGGGSLTFANEHSYATPSTVTYQILTT